MRTTAQTTRRWPRSGRLFKVVATTPVPVDLEADVKDRFRCL
jgi:hypothetical protein